MDLEVEMGEMELSLAEVESLISARDKEVIDLKVALEENEDKFYDMGFADVESSSELVMFQSRLYGFGEGWMAAVNALGVPEKSHFRILEQIPYPKPPPPPIQSPTCTKEEESRSMRALVKEIDSHTKLIDFEISSDPNVGQRQVAQPLLPNPDQVTIKANPYMPKQLQELTA